ncbi:MAG: hypothetical protein JWP85_1534 [Rhodoglobus sp.]|nr:hypothetical protein [Rhodoglobus sp.]
MLLRAGTICLAVSAAVTLLGGCSATPPPPVLFLSDEQLSGVYDDFTNRLLPCLRLLGLSIGEIPARDLFVSQSAGYPRWNPYLELEPTPAEGDWPLIAARCPPPALVPHLLPD